MTPPCRLRISNIPPRTSAADWEEFSSHLFGRQRAWLEKSEGLVDFDTRDNAQYGLGLLNGIRWMNHRIAARFDTPDEAKKPELASDTKGVSSSLKQGNVSERKRDADPWAKSTVLSHSREPRRSMSISSGERDLNRKPSVPADAWVLTEHNRHGRSVSMVKDDAAPIPVIKDERTPTPSVENRLPPKALPLIRDVRGDDILHRPAPRVQVQASSFGNGSIHNGPNTFGRGRSSSILQSDASSPAPDVRRMDCSFAGQDGSGHSYSRASPLINDVRGSGSVHAYSQPDRSCATNDMQQDSRAKRRQQYMEDMKRVVGESSVPDYAGMGSHDSHYTTSRDKNDIPGWRDKARAEDGRSSAYRRDREDVIREREAPSYGSNSHRPAGSMHDAADSDRSSAVPRTMPTIEMAPQNTMPTQGRRVSWNSQISSIDNVPDEKKQADLQKLFDTMTKAQNDYANLAGTVPPESDKPTRLPPPLNAPTGPAANRIKREDNTSRGSPASQKERSPIKAPILHSPGKKGHKRESDLRDSMRSRDRDTPEMNRSHHRSRSRSRERSPRHRHHSRHRRHDRSRSRSKRHSKDDHGRHRSGHHDSSRRRDRSHERQRREPERSYIDRYGGTDERSPTPVHTSKSQWSHKPNRPMENNNSSRYHHYDGTDERSGSPVRGWTSEWLHKMNGARVNINSDRYEQYDETHERSLSPARKTKRPRANSISENYGTSERSRTPVRSSSSQSRQKVDQSRASSNADTIEDGEIRRPFGFKIPRPEEKKRPIVSEAVRIQLSSKRVKSRWEE